MNLQIIIAIGSGGFIGAILRYYCSVLISYGAYSTVFINVLGSFIMGFAYAYFLNEFNNLRYFICLGILASFTSYSTFALDNFLLLSKGFIIESFFNIFLNLFASLVAFFFGYKLFKSFL